MKRTNALLLVAVAGLSIAACDKMKEAFSAHADTVARADGQELSTERLATLLGNSQIPVRKDVAQIVADLWVSYQLLGHAGAHGDSLADPALADRAMWAMIAARKAEKFYQVAKKSFPKADTTGLDQKYAQGGLLAAQHILIMMPENGAGMSKEKQDSVRRHAEDIRKKVTGANFNQMAKQYTEEPGAKDRNGELGVFPPGSMMPEFEAGVRALKPGEVSTALVQTSYGFHIIRRNLLSEVHTEFVDQLMKGDEQTAMKKYTDKLQTDYKLTMKPGILPKVRELAKDPHGCLADKTVLATSRTADFTAGRMCKWVLAFPQQSQQQVLNLLLNAPDTTTLAWIKGIAGQELIIAEADKNKVVLDSSEANEVRSTFATMVRQTSRSLGVDPKALGDSAASTAEREKTASQRIETALDQLFASNGAAGFVDVPEPLAWALRDKYSARVNAAGVDRALERAQQIRAGADSARAAANPNPTGLPPGATPVPNPPQPKGAPPAKGKSGK